MNELIEKEKVAIARLKNFVPEDGKYYVCYSGGKDSDVIRILCYLAGVPHSLHHNLTTADAPETVQYIKSLGNVAIEKAYYSDGTHKTMWNLIPRKKMPPTRLFRYCCSELKEHGGDGFMKVIGVRWAESRKRSENGALLKIIGKPKKVLRFAESNQIKVEQTKQGGIILNYDNSDSRRLAEFCYRTSSTMLSPIIDWSDSDVWNFLHHYGCSSNPLYSCGYHRVGCVGCPMTNSMHQKIEFSRYPKIRDCYIRAFDKMLLNNPSFGSEKYGGFTSGLDVFRWWLGDNPNQLAFDGFDLSEI